MHTIKFIYFVLTISCNIVYIYIKFSHSIIIMAYSLYLPHFYIINSHMVSQLTQSFWVLVILWAGLTCTLCVFNFYNFLYYSHLKIILIKVFRLNHFMKWGRCLLLTGSLERTSRWYLGELPWPISLLKEFFEILKLFLSLLI